MNPKNISNLMLSYIKTIRNYCKPRIKYTNLKYYTHLKNELTCVSSLATLGVESRKYTEY